MKLTHDIAKVIALIKMTQYLYFYDSAQTEKEPRTYPFYGKSLTQHKFAKYFDKSLTLSCCITIQ